MLLTGTQTLTKAAENGWALPAFATYNLEMVQAIVAAAERTDRPVLLLAGSSHFHHAGRQALIDIALRAAHASTAPSSAVSPRSTSTPNSARPTSWP